MTSVAMVTYKICLKELVTSVTMVSVAIEKIVRPVTMLIYK